MWDSAAVVRCAYNNLRGSFPWGTSEAHLVDLEVGPLPLEEPVYGLVLAAAEEHEDRLPCDRHLERSANQRDRVPPHTDLDPRELLDQPTRLAPSSNQPTANLGQAILGVRELFDVEDLQVGVLVEESERPISGEPARHRMDDVAGLQGQDRIVRRRLVDRDLAVRGVHGDSRPGGLLEAVFRRAF